MSADPTAAPPDPRRNVYRDDLASDRLMGVVEALRYTSGERRQVRRAAIPLRRWPSPGASIDTEALFGETLVVYDEADGWAWVQLDRDGYVGYVRADSLSCEVVETTHRVKAHGTFIYPQPDIKSPPLMVLSLNAALAIEEVTEKFARLAQGGFVPSRHVCESSRFARDFVEVAEGFIGTPYLWGGRTRLGFDCSGLVQISMESAGLACPRDSDMQQAEVGTEVLVPQSLEGLERGDLVFWQGHVGIMSDGLMLLHANAHHMSVVIETLPEAAQRIERGGSSIVAVRRPAGLTA